MGSRRIAVVYALVIGGGVIGLLTAFELRGRGLGVVLLERDQPGRQASWASAGILSKTVRGRTDPGGRRGAGGCGWGAAGGEGAVVSGAGGRPARRNPDGRPVPDERCRRSCAQRRGSDGHSRRHRADVGAWG